MNNLLLEQLKQVNFYDHVNIDLLEKNKSFIKHNINKPFIDDEFSSLIATTYLNNAVEASNLEVVNYFLNLGADPNPILETSQLIYTTSPLQLAIDNFSIFNSLIQSGADIHNKTTTGETILFHLAMSSFNEENKKIFYESLELGLNINEQNIKKQTPLMWATRNGNLSFLNEALKNKGDIYLFDIESKTVFDYIKDIQNLQKKQQIEDFLKKRDLKNQIENVLNQTKPSKRLKM